MSITKLTARLKSINESRFMETTGGFVAKDQGLSGCTSLWSVGEVGYIAYSPYDKNYEVNWDGQAASDSSVEVVDTGSEAFKLAKEKGLKFLPKGIKDFTEYMKESGVTK